MRIVIVGAGISGCATYLLLKKHLPRPLGNEDDHTYTIYEAYDTARDTTYRERTQHGGGDVDGSEGTHSATLVVGGGLGVGPNGLNVIRRLDEEIFDDLQRAGYPYSHFQIKNAYGWNLMKLSAVGGGESDGDDVQYSLSLTRHALWRSLRDKVPDHVIVTKRIAEIVPNANGGVTHLVKFVDGSEPVEADLVIGADGLKSVVKRALFVNEAEALGEDPYPPHYEGLVGIGEYVPVSDTMKANITPGSMNIIFGGNGFFGYVYSKQASPSSAPTASADILGWWSTYSIATCPDPKTIDPVAVTEQLRTRHKHWRDPVISEIVSTSTDTLVEHMYPVWTTPELPCWERDGIVLVGDAAHALPPTSGQGSSQALEDAECLALFLGHYLRKHYETEPSRGSDVGAGPRSAISTEREAVHHAAKQFVNLRYPRVKMLLDEAKRMQQGKKTMSVVQEFLMYIIMWLIGRMSNGESLRKRVLEYNIAKEAERVIAQEERTSV